MAQSPSPPTESTQHFSVLGIRVDAVQIPQTIDQIERWIASGECTHYVAVTGMHGVTESLHDANFRAALLSSNLVVPDGMPLVWLGRWKGYALRRRVYGPELMDTFCRVTGNRYRHFFYGGVPGVADQLAANLRSKHGIEIAGTYSPPFRPLSPDEDREVVTRINDSAAHVLWVGLSTPKQEQWMYSHRQSLVVPVMLGVGAAFDLNLGRIRQAPCFMQEHGLEWLFRLMMEPRRLWRRYLLLGPKFAWNVSFELLGLKRYE